MTDATIGDIRTAVVEKIRLNPTRRRSRPGNSSGGRCTSVRSRGVAKQGSWPAAVRTSSPSPFGMVTVKEEDVTFEALAELMAAADAIARDSSRRRN